MACGWHVTHMDVRGLQFPVCIWDCNYSWPLSRHVDSFLCFMHALDYFVIYKGKKVTISWKASFHCQCFANFLQAQGSEAVSVFLKLETCVVEIRPEVFLKCLALPLFLEDSFCFKVCLYEAQNFSCTRTGTDDIQDKKKSEFMAKF